VAATKTAAEALDLDEHIGTVAEGKLADLTIVDGDPLAEPHLLSDPSRIWLVLQRGVPVAGQALAAQALVAATKTAAEALGLDDHIGTVTEGKLADLAIVDGDPLAEPHLLADPGRIWLVLQRGVPVAGQALAGQALVNPAP